jgi:hypothetical protein
MNFDELNLLGIDVGFSKVRATTGLAWSLAGEIGAARTYTDWPRRERALPPDTSFDVIAIDGPIIENRAPRGIVRRCEQLLSRGTFQKRCKPGASHYGTGLLLREAATDTACQFGHLGKRPRFEQAVIPDTAIVEAFPNAFLGVMLEEAAFQGYRIVRGRKFDYLYDRAVAAGHLSAVLETIGWNNQALVARMAIERDHELRAALICLLTAACVVAGQATAVGDSTGGWIWLPPVDLWADWAKETLATNSANLPPP